MRRTRSRLSTGSRRRGRPGIAGLLVEPAPGAEWVVPARSLGFALLFVFGVRMAAVFMLVASTIGLRTGLLPRWLVAGDPPSEPEQRGGDSGSPRHGLAHESGPRRLAVPGSQPAFGIPDRPRHVGSQNR